MKKLCLCLLAVLLSASLASADAFQLVRRSDRKPIANAKITYQGKLIAYTNDDGVAVIKKPSGRNLFTVSHRGREEKINLSITGSRKVIEILLAMP